MRAPWAGWSLARQLLLLQSSVILVVGLLAAALAVVDARSDAREETGRLVRALASATAQDPDVVRALTAAKPVISPTSELQSHIEQARAATGSDFIVVMTPDGTRLTHPNPEQIGGHYIGTIEPALEGRPFTETYTGTLGPSVRSIVPVTVDGRVVGMVAVGVTVVRIGQRIASDVTQVALFAVLALALATLGALAISRRLRRQTHGLGALEMTRMYEAWDAVLHSMREGLLVFDLNGRLQLANDEAGRLLAGVTPVASLMGSLATDTSLPAPLVERVMSGRTAVDEMYVVGDKTLVVNQQPSMWEGKRLGTVMTLRDQSELQSLGGQIASLQGFADSLRAQMHESANQLHTVVTLVELGRTDEAVDFATAELRASQALTDRLMSAIQEPVLAALLLGKISQAAERGVELRVTDDSELTPSTFDPSELVTVCGNLIDNAIDAAMLSEPPHLVDVTVKPIGDDLLIRVHDSGPGLDAQTLELALQRGWSTKEHGEYGRGLGLALVNQIVRRHAGDMLVHGPPGTTFDVRLPGGQA
jgi:two-component system CitB family sensor kinase